MKRIYLVVYTGIEINNRYYDVYRADDETLQFRKVDTFYLHWMNTEREEIEKKFSGILNSEAKKYNWNDEEFLNFDVQYLNC